jgi:hypothetical protein
MKSKIKVRQHRSAARPSPQAKTSRNHKPETVRIVINDEAGKAVADFEIPKVMHTAMLRAARRAGISLWDWMQNAVREKIASGKPAENPPAPGIGNDKITLLFFNWREDTPIAHVDLAKGQFDAIALHAARAGISLEQALNDGIAQVLKLMETKLSDAACALKEVAS